MRTRRYETGALSLNQIKVGFIFDAETGKPADFYRQTVRVLFPSRSLTDHLFFFVFFFFFLAKRRKPTR